MNVFFDYQIFYLQRYGGISRYFYELANELNNISDCDPKIVVPFNANEYIDAEKSQDFILTFNPILKKFFDNRFYNKQIFMNEFVAQKLASGKKNTILHETYYTNRFSVKAPKVITIHDMIYELFNSKEAEEVEIIEKKKRAILEADAIISVSENTKKDLLKFYPQADGKITVVHHGVSQSTYPAIAKFENPKSFILHVGNRGWYKNFDQLLEVFGEQKRIHSEVDLICFGGGKVTKKEEALILKYNLQNKVRFISGNDKLLISLYKGAKAFVYISNYEGFGMPLLEAMALGCPVLSSNTSSLPEVYGDAALAIDPKNKEALVNGLNAILFDLTQRKMLIEKGLKRSSSFTWRKCAQETHSVYANLLK